MKQNAYFKGVFLKGMRTYLAFLAILKVTKKSPQIHVFGLINRYSGSIKLIISVDLWKWHIPRKNMGMKSTWWYYLSGLLDIWFWKEVLNLGQKNPLLTTNMVMILEFFYF